MISLLEPLACGAAVRIFLKQPGGALAWRIERRRASAPDDPAERVYTGDVAPPLSPVLLDYTGLVNGIEYQYAVWWDDDPDPANTVSVTPAASYVGVAVDPQDFLVERLDAGLQVELARGTITAPTGQSSVEVVRAFALYEQSRLPLVTVELASSETVDRALGETWGDDPEDTAWKRHWTLVIGAWSLNPDQRIAYRQAIERIILANLAVFDAAGIYQVDLNWQDAFNDLVYDAPLYSALGTLTCQSLSRVAADQYAAVTTLTVSPLFDEAI